MDLNRTQVAPGAQRLRIGLALGSSYDLLLLALAAVLLPLLPSLPLPLVRVPLGLALVLLAPGYALAAALFARDDDLDGVVRAALSFGLSIAIAPVIALALDRLPWGINPQPIAFSLAGWIGLCCAVALARRWALVPAGQAYLPPTPPRSLFRRWRELSRRRRASYSVSMVAFAAGGLVLASLLLAPDPAIYLTEFYLLGKGGQAEDYPREAVLGQELQVTVGLTNREQSERTYQIEARADGQLLSAIGPLQLRPGETSQLPLRYALQRVGDDQQVDILLFSGANTRPYRTLRLWVNVLPPP